MVFFHDLTHKLTRWKSAVSASTPRRRHRRISKIRSRVTGSRPIRSRCVSEMQRRESSVHLDYSRNRHTFWKDRRTPSVFSFNDDRKELFFELLLPWFGSSRRIHADRSPINRTEKDFSLVQIKTTFMWNSCFVIEFFVCVCLRKYTVPPISLYALEASHDVLTMLHTVLALARKRRRIVD